MTIYLTALEDTKARLIAKEARFWGIDAVEDADLIEKQWKKKGYIVVRHIED